MDESADEDGAEAGAGHEEDLHHLPPPLEVLPQHQGGRVPRHRHPDTCARCISYCLRSRPIYPKVVC